MPSQEFTITIKGGTWNGYTFKKYSQLEANALVELIKVGYDLECNVEVKTLI